MKFSEIIDSLIDVTQVPTDKRNGEGYESARNLIHAELSNLEDVEVACYHEAGHWAQAVLVANQLGVDGSLVEVIGPRITFDSLNNEYDPTPTGLITGMNNWQPKVEKHVKAMARIAVAGGESIHHFYGPKRKRGDTNDIGRFTRLHKDARMRLGSIIQPPSIYVDEAREHVRKDFEDSVFRQLVKSKAELVKRHQFGPVFGFHTKETL